MQAKEKVPSVEVVIGAAGSALSEGLLHNLWVIEIIRLHLLILYSSNLVYVYFESSVQATLMLVFQGTLAFDLEDVHDLFNQVRPAAQSEVVKVQGEQVAAQFVLA